MENFSRAVKKLLADQGWELKRRGRGDHEIWWNPATGAKTVVDNSLKSRHLANKIVAQAGYKKPF